MTVLAPVPIYSGSAPWPGEGYPPASYPDDADPTTTHHFGYPTTPSVPYVIDPTPPPAP